MFYKTLSHFQQNISLQLYPTRKIINKKKVNVETYLSLADTRYTSRILPEPHLNSPSSTHLHFSISYTKNETL